MGRQGSFERINEMGIFVQFCQVFGGNLLGASVPDSYKDFAGVWIYTTVLHIPVSQTINYPSHYKVLCIW